MNNNLIHFFYEETRFRVPNIKKVKKWLISISEGEGFSIDSINYIICSDEYLIKMNREYLNHDYYTDIITFSNADAPSVLSADIFISIDRVKENAKTLNTPFLSELHRVLTHGILHLVGYNDRSKEEKLVMRKKEDRCLSLRDF